MHGQFVWHDLMTTDVAGAKRFYSPLTGWTSQLFDKSTPENPYTVWSYEGTPLGGVVELSREQRARGNPPAWLPSVSVNNVDSTVRQAESLGGKVHMPPADVPDTGRYAVLQDPQGAAFAVFTPKYPMPGYDGTPKIGRFAWMELMTTDYKRAFDFYRQLFGWEKVGDEMDMGGGKMYFMYGMKGKMFGGIFNRQPNMANVPPFWLSYIFVKDADKSTDAAVKAGALLVNGPMDTPEGGRIAVLGDPQGAAMALFSKSGQPATKSARNAKPKAKAKAKAKSKAKPKAKAKSKAKKPAKTRPKAKAKKKSRRR